MLLGAPSSSRDSIRARRASIKPARRPSGRPSVHRIRETRKSADLRDKCARPSSRQRRGWIYEIKPQRLRFRILAERDAKGVTL